jgi:hypothetical protein
MERLLHVLMQKAVLKRCLLFPANSGGRVKQKYDFSFKYAYIWS